MQITQEQVRHAFDYDPLTGVLKWKNPVHHRVWVGKICRSPGKKGYYRVQFVGKLWHVHRIIFLYMKGRFPNSDLDHINGIVNDNRWVNLREATASENRFNSRRYRNNTSGFKGVAWCKQKNKWRGRVKVEGKEYHAGFFDDIHEAVNEVQELRNNLHKNFANHG